MIENMPQEIEVRYILPAIRREFAKILVEELKKPQKETAKILDITEAAVSQYLHSKRAREVVFTEEARKEMRKSIEKLTSNYSKQRLIAEIYGICKLTDVRHILCDIHRSQSKELENCNVCFEEGLALQIPRK